MVKMRCLPMSGFDTGTPCLIEKAWICFSFNLEEAYNCKRATHFLRRYGTGFSGKVGLGFVKEEKWFLGLCGKIGVKECREDERNSEGCFECIRLCLCEISSQMKCYKLANSETVY